MFNLQGSEIIFILLLALVVLGPEKLPGAIRRFTRTYAELRKMGNSFQQEVKTAFDEPMREVRETADLIKQQVDVESLEAEQAASAALDESAAHERADAPAADADTSAEPPSSGAPMPFAPPSPGASRVILPAPFVADAATESSVDPEPAAPPRPTVPAPPPPFAASHAAEPAPPPPGAADTEDGEVTS